MFWEWAPFPLHPALQSQSFLQGIPVPPSKAGLCQDDARLWLGGAEGSQPMRRSLGWLQQCRGGDSSSQGGDIPSTMQQGRVLSILGAALPLVPVE